MRDGTELDLRGLQREAAHAAEESGRTQSAIARELDVHRSAVSRALRHTGRQFAKLQCRIIEHLTPYRLEERRTWKAHRSE